MSNKQSNKLETWGNETTMNMNAILYQNILASPYFKSLYEKKTFHEVVDEIYYEVSNLAPFIKGTTPSTAFCCLYKFWTQRLTVRQVENLVDHPDSPYIRAIGFLYLRYVLAPAQYWDWFQYYLDDDEEVNLTGGPNPQKSTIGKLCRMLLTEQKFLGTMLPRIPVPIARDLEQKLKEYDREHGHGSHRNKDDYHAGDRDGRDSGRSRRDYRSRSRSPRRRDYDDRRRDRDRHHHRSYRDSGGSSRDRSGGSRYEDDDEYYGSRRRSRSHGYRHRYSRSRSRSRTPPRSSSRRDRSRSRSRDHRRY